MKKKLLKIIYLSGMRWSEINGLIIDLEVEDRNIKVSRKMVVETIFEVILFEDEIDTNF